MKLVGQWQKIAEENTWLRALLCLVTICMVAMGFFMTQLATREPLVFDTQSLRLETPSSEALIHSFLKASMEARFSSNTNTSLNLLSPKMLSHRQTEQLELSRSKVDQKVLVRNIEVSGNKATVTADKILAMGKLRSALVFEVEAQFRRVKKSESNPFGLILTECSAIKEEKDA